MRKSRQWTVSEEEFRDAKKKWDDFFDNKFRYDAMLECYLKRNQPKEISERFGTAPVRDAYWSYAIGKESYQRVPACGNTVRFTTTVPPRIRKKFNHKLLTTPKPTMIFKRYPGLSVPTDIPSNILVRALLGMLDQLGCKMSQGIAILNDAWTINLRSSERENLMLDMFLKGFDGKSEELKKLWESKMHVDVSEELKDLLKVYKDAADHLAQQKKYRTGTLVSAMKDFIKTHEELEDMEKKLKRLMQKLTPPKPCEEGCDQEDEDEDEE